MTNNSNNETYYTVTWFYPEGMALTGKEVFYSIEEVKSYIGREIVGDDGSLSTKTFRINTHSV